MKVISIVGMAGAGKTEVASVFEKHGFKRIRFGDITDEEIKKRGLTLNEASECLVREQLRQEQGMDAYAKLNLARIDEALKYADVAIDGLYSWEEYIFLKEYYGPNFYVVAVWSTPETRYARLTGRQNRSLTLEEAISRDREEIEEIKKGGPIAMADFTIINESSLQELRKQTEKVIAGLK
ncbi:MAG: AAA family ATPase [Dehalococcoidia bacterium]|nr:MAG: AAA family ATPase [Dehalococcoidia bacterium]